jgi:hypothetical protein
MYKGEIDFEYMKVKASDAEIINEIINGLSEKRAGGITLENNVIKFYGGILCGIIFNWCLLTGITKGKITVENNKIQYSLSFLETYIFFSFLIPIVSMAVFVREDGMFSFLCLFPVIFFVLIIVGQEFFGSGRFRRFLEACIRQADEKAKNDMKTGGSQ